VQRIVTCTGWTRHEDQYQRQKIIVGYSITSRFRHFTKQLVGKGKRAWLCAHLGARRCSRQGKVSAQHLQISGTKAEHTRKRSDGGLWFGDDAEPEVATAQHSNVMA
jgi:endonuclease YncB( thermonuclease family)